MLIGFQIQLQVAGLSGTKKMEIRILQIVNWHGQVSKLLCVFFIFDGKVCFKEIWQIKSSVYIQHKNLLRFTHGFSADTQNQEIKSLTPILEAAQAE